MASRVQWTVPAWLPGRTPFQGLRRKHTSTLEAPTGRRRRSTQGPLCAL